MPTAIIPCAGQQRRFEGWPAPKQLAEINGEPVLDRTIRQLREHGVTTIHVIASDERLRRPEAELFTPERHRWLAETILATRPLWQERTLILLGDVVFSDRAVGAAVASTGSPRFMGRSGANLYTLCPWSELFGLAFDPADADRVAELARAGLAHGLEGGPGKLSCMYAALLGVSPRAMQHGDRPADPDHFLVIDDWTDDLDLRIEHDNLRALHETLPPESGQSKDTRPEDLIASAEGLARYLDRAERLLGAGMARWARVGFEFVLAHRPDNGRAAQGLAFINAKADPMLMEDENYWDQWAVPEGEPHPAVTPATLAIDRLGRERLLAVLDALRTLTDEGAQWAGPVGRTLYRVLTDQTVGDRELLALAYVLTHAMYSGGDLKDLVLAYPG